MSAGDDKAMAATPDASPPTSVAAVLPAWLGGREVGWLTAFSVLSLLIHACRATVISVLPLQALAVLGTAQAVSVLYLAVSLLGLVASLSAALFVKRFRTRGVFVGAAGLMVVAMPLAASHSLAPFAAGMACFAFGQVGLEVAFNLYVLDRIRRRDLATFEPRRILFGAVAYTVGPSLGVFLETRVAHAAPFVLTACIALGAVVFLDVIGLRRAGARETLARSTDPRRNVGRYFAQPRLRLAWFAAVARSAWWATFFVYAPIYAVTTGLGEVVGGLLVSTGSLWTFTVTFWGRMGRRYGLRRLYVAGYATTGAMACAAWALGGWPWLGAACIVAASFGAAVIDGGGNVLFLRAVRPLERSEMAGVFVTFRDTSQLLPPAIASFLLRVAPLPVMFLVAGSWMLVMAWVCRFIPRRM